MTRGKGEKGTISTSDFRLPTSDFRILFVELLGGIGDVLIALPAIQALGRSYPEAKLTVLTFAPGCELLENDPLIHNVVCVDKGKDRHPQLARQAVEELLQQKFDLIVSDSNYDGIDRLIQQSGAPRIVTNLWRSPPPNERVGDRFLQILLAEKFIAPAAIAAPQLHLSPTEKLYTQQVLGDLSRPLVVLYPDAGMTIKQWSVANYISIGQELQRRYGATIIVPTGSDRQQALHIAHQIGGATKVLPRGTLREFAAAIASADLFVAADTGPARIAAALGIPTITLFGPSWHERYGQPSPHINLQGYPECSDRQIHNFTLQSCWYSGACPLDSWQTCLEAIAPADVLAAAASLLEERGVRSKERGEEEDKEDKEDKEDNSKTKINSQNFPTSNFKLQTSDFSIAPQWSNARNILVMRLDNIGDVLMTSPALRAIKENLPQARLTLMASPGGVQAATLLPWIDEVLPWRVLWQDIGKLNFDPAREWELISTVRDRYFDAAIIFTSFSQTPHPAAYMCYLAGIPLRLGESKEWGGGVLTNEMKSTPDEIHQVERNLQLIESVGFGVSDRSLTIHIPAVARHSINALLQEHGLTTDTPYLLLNPWTSCQSRNYDWQRFAEAARRLAEITGWTVVVTGVAKDRDRSEALLAALQPYAIDAIGATNLAQLAALIAGARLVLTNNTSTMHLADATRTPSVIMFAGTEYESQWQPRHTASRLLRQPTPCSPCYAFTCPYNLECLDIPSEQVVAAGLELLQSRVTQS